MSILIGNSQVLNQNICKEKINENYKISILNELRFILDKLNIETKNIEYQNIENNNICIVFWTRDIFVNIDNTIILLPCNSNIKNGPFRKNEYKLLKNIFNKFIINDKENTKLEGGDIIQDEDIILIGYNVRTNKKGIEFIKNIFNKKNIIGIKHNALHLDCCLSILDEKIIIYSSKYIKKLPKIVEEIYTCIKLEDIIEKDVELNLALNLLLIGKNIITAHKDDFEDLYDFLKIMGYKLHFIKKYSYKYNYAGGIRCMTQWIKYPKNQKIR